MSKWARALIRLLALAMAVGSTVAATMLGQVDAVHRTPVAAPEFSRDVGTLPLNDAAAAVAAPRVTREQVLANVRSRQGPDLSLNRVEAKLTTVQEFRASRGVTNEYIAALRPEQRIWLVATSGNYRPQLARGEVFDWGIFAFDAETGAMVFTYAGRGETWPRIFVNVTDQAR